MNDSTHESEKKGWFGRLAGGLKRTSTQLGSAIAELVTKGPMDPAKLDMIQDALVRADLGYDLAKASRPTRSRPWSPPRW